ncbi:MAG: Response regulator receiver domain protein (CheY-like) [Microgenomates group bacterium GW2011_GWA1_48_10]|nr:MAG: Response regulator receiver domain protein (CheY-like) [Microgenomates group bacterium GW2011_GWA1_48_10]
MRLLLVEDEKRLSGNIKKGLMEQGFAVDQAFDGEEGEYLAESEDYDLIILDIMLPKRGGVEVCKNLRKRNIRTPILMLTAKTEDEDVALGLDNGADDYLKKPFSFLELRSRIQALLRRSHNQHLTALTLADLELDPIKHTVTRGGKNILLTPKEFSVLEFLMHHKNEVVTRTMIIEHVWDYNFEGMSNVVDVFIATLRRKIDKASKVKLLTTLHGVGYRIGVE